MKNPKKIVIVGLGLMGGSLAGACRKAFRSSEIVGISRSKSAVSTARRKKWINTGTDSIARGANGADLIILCTPVDVLVDQLVEVDKYAESGALAMDVGSIKGEIFKKLGTRSFTNIRFVGAHPMVGSHENGMKAADPKLYEGGLTFLVDSRHAGKTAFARAKSFWRQLAMKVVAVRPDEHDQIVAQISHLPHAIASSLMLSVDKKSLQFAASGFRDTTRIAASHPSVWGPIFLANREAIQILLKRYSQTLKELSILLEEGDAQKLEVFLSEARLKRLEI